MDNGKNDQINPILGGCAGFVIGAIFAGYASYLVAMYGIDAGWWGKLAVGYSVLAWLPGSILLGGIVGAVLAGILGRNPSRSEEKPDT